MVRPRPAARGRLRVAEVRVFYDREGGSLTVWFGEPTQEFVSEETRGEAILMKNAAGRIIGIERLNFCAPARESPRLELSVVPA